MKKILIFLFFILLVTGCDKTDVKTASNNMNKLKSFEFEVNINLKHNLVGNEVLNTINYKGQYNKIFSFEKKQTFFGVFNKQQMYIKDSYKYFDYDDNWYKEEIESKLNFDIFKKIKSVEINNNLYTVIFDEKYFEQLTSLFLKDASFDKEQTKIILTINNKLIEKINIIAPINYDSRDYDCEIIVDFKRYNELEKINIPSNIISDSLDYAIYDKRVLFENYINELINHMYKNNLTKVDNNLEFNGISSTEINVTFVDGIMNGYIIIDDYKMSLEEDVITNFEKLK